MKYFLIILILMAPLFIEAQDRLVKMDNTVIKCKVIEIGPELIRYKKWTNMDGPTYSVLANDVNSIVFENGEIELIKHTTTARIRPDGVARSLDTEITWVRPNNMMNFNLLLLGFNQFSFAFEHRGESAGFRIPFYYNFDRDLIGIGLNPKIYLNNHPSMQIFMGPEFFGGYSDFYGVAVLGFWGGTGLSINPVRNMNITMAIAIGHMEFTGITTQDDGLVVVPELSFGLNF